jgi:GT2 family glycosyltransferase
MPKVSIILPLYNSEKFVEECLDSIQNQSLKDFELIVLDDCSTDNTVELLKKRSLNYISNEINLGFTKNLNQGIRLAEGDYIMIADHDMVYEIDYLRKMTKTEGDIIASRSYYYDEKDKIRSFGIKINLFTGKTNVSGRDEKDLGQHDNIYEIQAAAAGTLLIKKEVLSKIRFFDERYNKFYADVDFCLTAKKAGFKVVLSNAKSWHKKEEKETFTKPELLNYYNDKKLFLKKHSPYYPLSLIPAKIKGLISK